MKTYLTSSEEVIEELKSSENGLSSNEAESRLAKNGKNKLDEAKKTSVVVRFFQQLADPMVIILIVAAVISAITAFYEQESFTEVFIIMFVVVLNSALGVYQESKAEKAIEALAKMSASTSHVLRDGEVKIIKSEDLVVGDVILLEAGDAIPADARLLDSASLKIEESALTGESVPVSKITSALSLNGDKDIVLGDRKNMVYMGSSVAYGRGKAVVCATGMDTEMGKIANALNEAKDELTPLQLKLNELGKTMSILVIVICVVIFGVGILRGNQLLDTFMVAVSLAVAAIPEGLAAVVTIVLSVGVTKMSKKNAIIRKLTAVETLGCTEVICSDKTGTLTQNKMTVVDAYTSDASKLALAMTLCNDAEIDSNGDIVGEPTEAALVAYGVENDLAKNKIKSLYERKGEAPFDSGRKMMSTVHTQEDGSLVQFTKGAPDEVLKKCTHVLVDGNIVPLSEELKTEILAANKGFADQALRVLAAATKDLETLPADFEPATLENGLCFLGLTGLIDPIRPEVKDAIIECRDAGIRPIMITGDHKDTAIAIAKQLTIIEEGGSALTGAELNEMSDDELFNIVENYSVYARVQPEHKVRIVQAWKKKGKITAMTGDGVNDAPSIKNADIGIGMGITGTDVTKNVADMVLSDDNFATIVNAVEEGRRIYDNIRKSIQFLLSSNLAEVLAIFTATMLGFTILSPVHLLWINLITDSFPALALGMEDAEVDIMEREPRNPKDGVFADGLGFDVVYQGVLITILTVAAYFIGHYYEVRIWEIAESPDGMTMAFLTLSMVEMFHSFNVRSRRKSIFQMKSLNKFLIYAFFASLISTTLVLYVPFLTEAFGFTPINFTEYMISMGLAFSIIPIVEIIKLIQRKISK